MPQTTTKNVYDNLSEKIYSKPSYIGTVELIEYIIFIIILYWYNPFNITTTYPIFTNILTLIISLIYVILFYFLSNKIATNSNVNVNPSENNFIIKLIGTLSVFIISVILIKFISSFIAQGRLGLLSLLRYIIKFTFIIVALAGVYILIKPYFDKAKKSDKNTLSAFFFNLVMYFPCLILSFIDYIKYQYQITTKSVWILLLAECILIILWLIIPLVLHSFSTKNGIQLLKNPQYINTEITVGTFEQLNDENKVEKFNYHYALSFWFYLNPQPPNTSPAYNKFTNILTYGGKPAIEYNGALNILRVSVESSPPNNQSKIQEIFKTNKVLFQKWNNIVINYDRGTMDVFLNGELVGSKPEIAPYMTYENIKIGSNNGLAGGISNIMYYKNNLSKDYIELMYKTLRGKNEPFL